MNDMNADLRLPTVVYTQRACRAADLYISSLSVGRCLGVRENTVGLERSQGHLKVVRVGARVLDARKRRIVGELDAAGGQVVAAEHRRPITVVLDLDVVAGEVEQLQ